MRERPSASSVVAAVLARSALSLLLERPDLYNETRVHPRTREIIVTERGAFSRPARAVENWAPAAAGRTVKSARRAFGGWNASYTVVESRLFGEQRRLASQLAWRRDREFGASSRGFCSQRYSWQGAWGRARRMGEGL